MKAKKTAVVTSIVLLTATTIALGAALGVVYRKVAAFDRKYGSDVLANFSPKELYAKTNVVTKAAPTRVKTDSAAEKVATGEEVAQKEEKAPPELKVVNVEYDGDDEIVLTLSERPDMDVVRNYVKAEPPVEGRLTFRYKTPCAANPTLRIRGEFAYRTNVTLRVLKGFPLYGKSANPDAVGSLKEDFVYTFRRKDKAPYVKFADPGRYLPPGGLGAIALEAMNVTNVSVGVCRVEPHNVVQLLAREENVYSRYSWYESADDEETAELAEADERKTIPCLNQVNRKEKIPFSVSVNDGKPRNGIYLLDTYIEDHPVCDRVYSWDYGKKVLNPKRYRLVCVSDLGLSVRRWGKDGLGVWVTSLTTGKPVADTEITVYSSARVRIMEGVTDANGWCELARVDKGEMFALVAVAPENADMTFMALRESMIVDETYQDGKRNTYLAKDECTAFIWTERGIYRHDEKIFVHGIFRNGVRTSPSSFPVELQLVSPKGDVRMRESVMTDENGTVRSEKFSVSADLPSGIWTVRSAIPGGKKIFGEKKIKVEEFAPPQIRVKVDPDDTLKFPAFGFTVSVEHLFGGPAHNLPCEGAVVFEDVPFAPVNWKGWNFGNEMLGLKPSFRRLKEKENIALDLNGEANFTAPLWADSGLPKAAVRATAQGTVLEDGGRPATARKSVIRHYYPFYIGSTMPSWIKLGEGGRPAIKIACVTPDGKRLDESKRLIVKIEQIDSFYSYKKDERGWATWNCERVRSTIVDGAVIETDEDNDTVYELPLDKCGDYAITVTDKESRSSFGREFYLSDWGDNVVRAPLADPTKVSIAVNKAFYRAGETPRLVVKSPFAGHALLSVMRDACRYTQVISLTNATSEIYLRPLEADDAPNLDVYLSVVQGVDASSKRLAVRAHGQTTVSVRPIENEIEVAIKGKVDIGKEGASVFVDVAAPGASDAVITLVDEGINILTGEETPNPVRHFSAPRMAEHPLYDIYHRILPVLGMEASKANGVKTGGGFGAEMLSRVSPVPTRRFKPLALWQGKVPVVNGKASTVFRLPEFVGEVRVTAVAYNKKAAGAKSVQFKVSPKLVAMPDAPRFAAPNDRFDVTLPVYNRSGKNGEFSYSILADGKCVASADNLHFGKDASTNIVCKISAPQEPGEMELTYSVSGLGEKHVSKILLPVRPAVAWRETAGVKRLLAGEKFVPESGRFAFKEYDSPLGNLARSLEWLCDYPHGCLEQTVSRVFPLISAGGILSSVEIKSKHSNADVVHFGVRRVESMVRKNDFVMWPDVDYAPWDKEVSLYASHFLIAAEKSGVKVSPDAKNHVLRFLSKWALSTNDCVSAYALHNLAIAGKPDKDRMFRLYFAKEKLSLLSRARLARAFVEIGDRTRAKTLLANAATPSSVKEASFLLLSLLELDPDDVRVLPLVKYLQDERDRAKYCWGTTEENAHALMAIGEYYRFKPPQKGERFVAWRKLELPRLEDEKPATNGLSIVRSFETPEGEKVDVNNLKRGEMVYVKIEITSPDAREIGDLVVEDLFAGAMEPVNSIYSWPAQGEWVMRSDARDDRMLVFSKRISLKAGETIVFLHPMRVVSAGEFTLPGVSVEAMYYPELNARSSPCRITVGK